MNCRIRNKRTLNYTTKNISFSTAQSLMKKLSSEEYEIIPSEVEEKQKSKTRNITPAELEAITALTRINPSHNTTHVNFINYLLGNAEKKENMQLTEQQISFVWGLVWHYRAQITDGRLIVLANRNKS